LKGTRTINNHKVVIGIGSNIQPRDNLVKAINVLAEATEILAVSKVYRTPPFEGEGPDYLNAAAIIKTQLTISDFRDKVLRRIEDDLDRQRSSNPNAPRTIDLDILVYDGIIYDQNIWEYPHLCIPVADLLPLFADPSIDGKLSNCANTKIKSYRVDVIPLELHW
jgi:2-amino-4-hydroxy-6-hydroxymethyldihydropteridine diphosphokinase